MGKLNSTQQQAMQNQFSSVAIIKFWAKARLRYLRVTVGMQRVFLANSEISLNGNGHKRVVGVDRLIRSVFSNGFDARQRAGFFDSYANLTCALAIKR